jgi:hypothetical protein
VFTISSGFEVSPSFCILKKHLHFMFCSCATYLVAGVKLTPTCFLSGFEDMFELKNEKQAMEQEAYLWSVSDM